MKVEITMENGKLIIITDEHAASSYGIPVAVVDGEAYGPSDELPVWGENDELSFIHEKANRTVSIAAHKNRLTGEERDFVAKFYEN